AVQADLSKTVIRSPINGIVLTRNVEPGQTVAASLQAPVLFVLAEDLTKMELHVAVDEADVGQVIKGQDATFTVDAYPDKNFPARVTQVRYASQTVEGVVTYETVLNVDNSDLLLRPGMTATADIIVKKVKDGILIPNAALRFTPPVQQNNTSKESRGLVGALLPRPPRRNHQATQRQDKTANSHQKRIWHLKEGIPVPRTVTTGASDGQMTEVVAGEVKPGLPLIVDVMGAGK
ncbi:MAG: efflux RND transporter periplasmic adaptor subunit, partial [bacterium]